MKRRDVLWIKRHIPINCSYCNNIYSVFLWNNFISLYYKTTNELNWGLVNSIKYSRADGRTFLFSAHFPFFSLFYLKKTLGCLPCHFWIKNLQLRYFIMEHWHHFHNIQYQNILIRRCIKCNAIYSFAITIPFVMRTDRNWL